MNKRTSISDEQLYALIRESHPPEESFPPAAAERVLSQILASDPSESERPRPARAKRRRKMIRTGTLGVGAVLVLSGSALAAGNALGVIELGGGDTAETVATVRTMYQSSNGKIYDVNVPSGAAYTYRLAGGESNLHCADPELLVQSNRQLSSEELHKLLLEESAGPTHVRSDTLPEGVVGIGESCIPVHHTATRAEAEAAANAQAEAEAAGWTAEKWREQTRKRAERNPGGIAELLVGLANGSSSTTRGLTQAEAAEVEEAAAAADEAAVEAEEAEATAGH